MSEMIYAIFNKDTGDVLSVTNEVSDTDSYIPVAVSQVKSILDGKEPIRNYMVQYNTKTKTLDFVSRFEHVFDAVDVNEFIYEMPEEELEDPDILLIQDIPNTCWKIKVGDNLKKNIRAKGVSLNANILFSITAKSDPNILYRTFFVDFGKTVNDNYFIVPFAMPFEETNEVVSAYTSKRFDTYQYKRILND